MIIVKNEIKLSKESQEFLENLRVYLFSTGKNSDEIEGITEELETHLFEAEKNGKPIDKIIGHSPKEYMKMVSKEMAIDFRTWINYIILIVLGSFSVTIFTDLLEGNLAYSLLEIIGHIVIAGVFIISILVGFKYIASAGRSLHMQGLILFAIAAVPLLSYIGLIFLNRSVDTPIIHFNTIGSWIIGGLAAILILGITLWSKTWFLVLIVILLTLPNYLLGQTSLSQEMQMMITPWIMFGGIAIYLFVRNKLDKRKA